MSDEKPRSAKRRFNPDFRERYPGLVAMHDIVTILDPMEPEDRKRVLAQVKMTLNMVPAELIDKIVE